MSFRTSMAISPTPAKFGPLLFAGQWRLGLETALEFGYDAVEVSLRDPADPVVADLINAIRKSSLALSAVATGQSFLHDGLCLANPDPADRAKLLERMQRFIEIAALWEGIIILGGIRGKLIGDPDTFPGQRTLALEAIREYAGCAAEAGVRLALEPINRYETNFLNTVQDCLDLIDEAGCDNLVVLADTFHMNIEEKDMVDALKAGGPKLAYVHLADSNRQAPGQGHIDFDVIGGTLRAMGFNGYIGAEILPIPDSRRAAELAIQKFRSLSV
jgi:sugar phosphate isomerase/epimerase